MNRFCFLTALVCIALVSPNIRAQAAPDCTLASYTDGAERAAKCARAREVVPPEADATRRVPAALAALADEASRDDQLDPTFRDSFIRAIDRSLATSGTKPTSAFEVDAVSIADCGCVHVIGANTLKPFCLRFDSTPKRDDRYCALPTMHEITFDESEAGVARAVRHEAYADVAYNNFQELNATGRKEAHHGVAESLRKWKNFRRGLFQLPWESAINGRLGRNRPRLRDCPKDDELGPCRNQFIVLHPLAALGVQINNIAAPGKVERVVAATLGIEAIGFVKYRPDFRHYFGAAATVGVDNLVFEDPRVGLTLHLTKYLHVGYLVSVRSSTAGDGTVLLAGDLASWAQDLLSD